MDQDCCQACKDAWWSTSCHLHFGYRNHYKALKRLVLGVLLRRYGESGV